MNPIDRLINRIYETDPIYFTMDFCEYVRENFPPDRCPELQDLLNAGHSFIDIRMGIYALMDDAFRDILTMQKQSFNAKNTELGTGLQCPRCKSRNTVTKPRQTSSGDEPINMLIECKDCGRTGL